MKISFEKINSTNFPVEFKKKSLILKGNLTRINTKLVKFQCEISGCIENHICDRCGEEFPLDMNEKIDLILSDGAFQDNDNELSDTIEIFDKTIDIEEIFDSEIEAFKSGYFYCEKCENN